MEPLTILASTVGLISALHIAFSAEEFLTQGRYSKGNTQGKRVDWYCFFQPSDLVGNQKSSSSLETARDNLDERRRQQANRPRLQA